jgi:hypothetical protein
LSKGRNFLNTEAGTTRGHCAETMQVVRSDSEESTYADRPPDQHSVQQRCPHARAKPLSNAMLESAQMGQLNGSPSGGAWGTSEVEEEEEEEEEDGGATIPAVCARDSS